MPGRCRHRDERHLALHCGPRASVDGSRSTVYFNPCSRYANVFLNRIQHKSMTHDQEFILGPAQAYVVQQFIPGRVLHDAWPSLSWWMRFRVVLTVRYYVHQLRLISHVVKPSFPGPPSSDGLPQRCTGRLFTSLGDGPFPTYHDLERLYNNRLLVVQRFRKEGLTSAPLDATVPLVFTHKDLHCRNLISGDDGHL
jgi:hypothetical protein